MEASLGQKRALCCRSLTVALVHGVLSFIISTEVQQGRSYHDEAKINPTEVRRLHELSNVHAILKSNGIDLNDGSTRDVAATILDESKKHSLDPTVVLGVINVESRFRHKAVSTSGARGLMQVRPFVATALAEEAGLEEWNGTRTLDDPVSNIKIGVFYLGHLKYKFKDVRLALSAYLRGPTEIQNRLEQNKPVPLEYAKKVLSVSKTYRERMQEVVTNDETRQHHSMTEELGRAREVI
ncbi:MAG TPA: lytic transglycosylase domain-containing protein [Candidatus Binatia bacterium]|nr:lytic transglycosylase domain-containing protein [Candidatus Binatia bacterium]